MQQSQVGSEFKFIDFAIEKNGTPGIYGTSSQKMIQSLYCIKKGILPKEYGSVYNNNEKNVSSSQYIKKIPKRVPSNKDMDYRIF